MPLLTPPGPLQVERLPDGRRKLLRCLRYKVNGVKDPIEVCAGHVTDFSSDPIGLLDWSKVDVAGVIHDYLYQNPDRVGSRWQEDLIWFKIARSGKWRCSLLSAILGWAGLVLFGWMFRRDANLNASWHLRVLTKLGPGIGWFGLAATVLYIILAGIRNVYELATHLYCCLIGSGVDVELGIKGCVILVVSVRLITTVVRSRQRKNLDRIESASS